jgi:hypothetical protein
MLLALITTLARRMSAYHPRLATSGWNEKQRQSLAIRASRMMSAHWRAS